MGTISVTLPSDNTTADVADINNPINTIVNEFNGNIDNANIKAAAGIAGSKLADASVTSSKLSLGGQTAFVGTSESTTSLTYASLTTTTDTVTVTVGNNGLLLVTFSSALINSAGNTSYVGFALSGANTLAADDQRCIQHYGTSENRFGESILLTGLTAGSTTVALKYHVSGGTGTFKNRRVAAIPL